MTVKTNTHTAIHQQRIADVIRDYPGAQSAGFAAALRALVEPYDLDGADLLALVNPGFNPDAYLIDHEQRRIVVFEVEVTSVLPASKIIALGMWWFYWDCETDEWEPTLVLIDRYGHRNEVDLMHAYYRTGPFEGLAPAYGSARLSGAVA